MSDSRFASLRGLQATAFIWGAYSLLSACSAEFRPVNKYASGNKAADMDVILDDEVQAVPVREFEELISDENESVTIVSQTIEVSEEADPREIVIAIDTSLSMRDERQNLEQNLPVFLASLKQQQLDFQVTILAEPKEFNLPAMSDQVKIEAVEISSHDAISRLSSFMSSRERLSEATSLHYVFISDDNAKGKENTIDSLYVPEVKRFTSHAIVGIYDREHQKDCDIARKGQAYIDLAVGSKGAVLDVCAKDWNTLLLNLADSIRPQVLRQYPISKDHASNGIMHVFLNDRELSLLEDGEEAEGYQIREENLVISSDTELNNGDEITIFFMLNSPL